MTATILWARATRRAVFGTTLVLGVGCGWLLGPRGGIDLPRAEPPAVPGAAVLSRGESDPPDLSAELRAARIHRDEVLDDRMLRDALAGALDPRAADAVLTALHRRLLDRARLTPAPSDDSLRAAAREAAEAVRPDPARWLVGAGLLTVDDEDVEEWALAFLDALWDDPPSAAVLEWSDAQCREVHARALALARERLRGLRGRKYASFSTKERALARALEGLPQLLFAAPPAEEAPLGTGSPRGGRMARAVETPR